MEKNAKFKHFLYKKREEISYGIFLIKYNVNLNKKTLKKYK